MYATCATTSATSNSAPSSALAQNWRRSSRRSKRKITKKRRTRDCRQSCWNCSLILYLVKNTKWGNLAAAPRAHCLVNLLLLLSFWLTEKQHRPSRCSNFWFFLFHPNSFKDTLFFFLSFSLFLLMVLEQATLRQSERPDFKLLQPPISEVTVWTDTGITAAVPTVLEINGSLLAPSRGAASTAVAAIKHQSEATQL